MERTATTWVVCYSQLSMKDFIMGNEESHYPKDEIEEEAVEVTDNWSLHYSHTISDSIHKRSAFISQAGVNLASGSALERLAKNLMVHRHPCILKYISSWSKNNRFYLITEEVKPLVQVLTNQSTLQICIGLHSLLNALIFLHEKALSSHNNLCCATIYVTPEGVWKLGGLEFLKKFSEVTSEYLQLTRAHRYERSVPPEEDTLDPTCKIDSEAIDKYAFGVLVEELLRKKSNDEIPCLSEFKDYCKLKLQCLNPSERSKLSEILNHPFFSHNFIKIHSFLVELPLKADQEKDRFFRDLIEQLYLLPEVIIGSQLASLLLSRVVLLDETAQQHLLPIILQPKSGSEHHGVALFCKENFKLYIIPKLLQMFCVRDAQIRLILLKHFHSFCRMFTIEQLQNHVLPELLVGIKDIDDHLVSVTLKALADLVLILGAQTVIGGKRGKLFTDGRPKSRHSTTVNDNKNKLKDRSKESPLKRNSQMLYADSDLPERPSPDGGEDNSSSTTLEEVEVDTETWSDWDAPGEKKLTIEAPPESEVANESENQTQLSGSKSEGISNRTLPDITTLDIKSNVENARKDSKGSSNEVDFFHDMEPVISKTQVLNINTEKNKFDVELDEATANGGDWNDSFEDWGLEDENSSLRNSGET